MVGLGLGELRVVRFRGALRGVGDLVVNIVQALHLLLVRADRIGERGLMLALQLGLGLLVRGRE